MIDVRNPYTYLCSKSKYSVYPTVSHLYHLHLPLQTLKMCAHTKRNIFTVPLLLLTLSLTLLLVLTTCHSLSLSLIYTLPLHLSFFSLSLHLSLHPHSSVITPHCLSSVITPHCHFAFHSICCLILSTHVDSW